MSATVKVAGEPDTRISVCRLCALVSGSKSFIPLYLNKEPQVTTKEINQLVPNVISPDDGLPQEACFKCVENVSKCFKFINTVVDTQEKLRQMMRLSEAKLNDASPNQFYESDDQWSMAVDEDNDLRTPNNSVSKGPSKAGQGLASARKTAKALSARKSIDRAESSSSASSQPNASSATDAYINRLSSCTFKPVSAGDESAALPKKLFRCGVCFEKFTEKDVCLTHIAKEHSGVQKPVQPNTIFEAVRKGAADANSVPQAGAVQTPATGARAQPSKAATNGVTNVTRNGLDAVDEVPAEAPKKSRRKVLAIDSFYLEVNKRCTRYVCDDCGRMMMSRFAFQRHLHEHREPLKPAPPVTIERAKRRQVSRGDRRYCNVCKKSVRDGLRHRMYHAIVTLESQFPSSASMLANLTTLSSHAYVVEHDPLDLNAPTNDGASAEPLFATVNDIVELLVVHPEEMVHCELDDMLKDAGELNVEANSNSTETITGSPVMLIKEEVDVVLEQDEDEAAKEPTEESMFLEKFDVVEVPKESATLYDAVDKECRETEVVEVLYECSVCLNTFVTENDYMAHVCPGAAYEQDAASSRKSRDYECQLCNRVFRSYFVYQMHMSQHTNLNLCHVCNATFLDYGSLVDHICEDHPQLSADLILLDEENAARGRKQCDICGKITNNLKQHKMYHTIKELEFCKEENKRTMKKWFLCKRCNKKIFSEANYLFHLAQHDGEDFVQCRQCDYVATNVQNYNMHITVHTGSKYFICHDCGKCFFTRSAISDHVLIHMEGSRYMCEICGKRFKTSRSNAQHKLLQHKKYFRCSRCNRGFTHEAKLTSHFNICRVIHQDTGDSKVFEPVEKFFCNICNSNIKSSSEISILFHKAKHEGKEGVECRFCNLLCKNACMYKNHLLIHTNQRPYACSQCPKSFRTKGCLVQHMLVHGNEYKYTCEYCGKKSKKLTTHVNHVNIHTDTKPYKCPDCARPFRQLSDMKKHRRTHLKYKMVEITSPNYGLAIKTEIEDIIAVDSIQQIRLV